MADWETHVSTVFPDVRLKQFIEMRGADANGASHIAALSALWVGLLYDRQSLDEAHELISGWNIETIQEVRSQVPVKALNAESGNLNAGNVSRKIYQMAKDGLTRQSQLRGIDNQSCFLAPVSEITESGITIAEKLLQRYKKNTERLPELIYRWQKEQMEECANI
jgi:glutamate--cysteine ligase